MKDKESKLKPKKNKNQQSLQNKKHINNKILKAKEILAKNKAALEKASEKKKEEAAKRPLPLRILSTVKKVFFGVLIILLAAVLISFFVVRVNGGTPDFFGYSIQRIVSGSMEPTLLVGDIILSKTVENPSEIELNDIVTFQGGSDFEYNTVTHRVVAPPSLDVNGEYVLTTKGDANNIPDAEIKFDTVKSKLVQKIDFLNKFFEFFMSPWGLLSFIAVLLIVFFDELLTVVKVITGNFDDDEDDESVGDIMDRLKTEELERERAEALRKERAKKRNNTSKKKLKKRSEKDKKPSKQKMGPGRHSVNKPNSKKSKKKNK